MKHCRLCGKLKSLDQFYKASKRPDGHQSDCIECNKARLKRPPRAKPIIGPTKICTACKHEKARSEFPSDKQKHDGLSYYCKECTSAKYAARRAKWTDEQRGRKRQKDREYKEAHLDEIRTRARVYHWTKRDERLAYLRQYAEGHREELRQKSRERYYADHETTKEKERERARRRYGPEWRARWNEWSRRNKHKRLIAFHKRRAAKLGNGGTHTQAEWETMLDAFGHKCLACGTTERLTRDHVVPLTRGGTDHITNIQPLCHSCNSKKGNRDVADFRDANVFASLTEKLGYGLDKQNHRSRERRPRTIIK